MPTTSRATRGRQQLDEGIGYSQRCRAPTERPEPNGLTMEA